VADVMLAGLTPSPSSKAYGAKTGDQFLQFRLYPDMTTLLGVQHIAEILTIPVGQVVPIPHMPAWVMGVYNWRGEILWVTDLGNLIGLPALHQQNLGRSHYSIVVIHDAKQNRRGQRQISQTAGRKLLGLAVTQIEGMEWYESNQIQSPPGYAVTPEIAPYLRGYLMKPNGDLLVTLDGYSILAQIPQSHT
jgi:positive phototaxis protein PixI